MITGHHQGICNVLNSPCTESHPAQVVRRDDSLWRLFEQECYSYEPGGGLPLPPYMRAVGRSASARRSCVSDEHYFPTLLAVAGLQNEVGAACRVGGCPRAEGPEPPRNWVAGAGPPTSQGPRHLGGPGAPLTPPADELRGFADLHSLGGGRLEPQGLPRQGRRLRAAPGDEAGRVGEEGVPRRGRPRLGGGAAPRQGLMGGAGAPAGPAPLRRRPQSAGVPAHAGSVHAVRAQVCARCPAGPPQAGRRLRPGGHGDPPILPQPGDGCARGEGCSVLRHSAPNV